MQLNIVTNMTTARQRFDKHRLKAGILEQSASPLLANGSSGHVSAATNKNAAIHVIFFSHFFIKFIICLVGSPQIKKESSFANLLISQRDQGYIGQRVQ
jgi:hypothetical protein